MHLFDAHCHLQDERLLPHLDAAMARAGQAGVSGLLCCGSCEADWPQVRTLARRYAGVRPAFGLHPWYVEARGPGWRDALRAHLGETPSAVGEIGLDHVIDRRTFADQDAVFAAQLELACELGRPVSIHCRQAWGRLLELLDRHGWPPAGVTFHSFSGAADLVPVLAARGALFSFSGSITYDRNRRGRAALAAVPLDRLLIETDAPDIPPALPDGNFAIRTDEGRPVNEPAHLAAVAGTVATLRGLTAEGAAELTHANAGRIFGA